MPTPDLAYAIGLPPKAAIEHFASKGYVLSRAWDDIADQTHARAFTVAGVMKLDVLQDIRAGLVKAQAEGKSLEQFKRDLIPLLEAKGWMGRGHVADPATGEVVGKRLTPRRLDTIYRTNLQSSFMAGRYQAQKENAGNRPYWEYVAILDSRTRPAHRALHGRIFKHDDGIWSTVYPPNGFGCRCRVRARSGRDLEREQLAVSSSEGRLDVIDQPVGRSGKTRPAVSYRDPITGERFTPDAGFGFNAGETALKPFAPPPLDELPRTFPDGIELPDLLPPTVVPASKRLARGLDPQNYGAGFKREFGLELGQSTVFRDVTGAPLVISDDLFKDGLGVWKADKDGRGPYMALLAMAVRDPDEIWLRWEPSRDKPGQWLLKRRYIKSWDLEGAEPGESPQHGLSVFEFGRDGWSGSSAMVANPARSALTRHRYIAKQRDGFLVYRRAK